MFESPDDLTAESHFHIVVVIDLRCLNVMATIEIFVHEVNANQVVYAAAPRPAFSKHVLHMIKIMMDGRSADLICGNFS